MEKKKFHVVKMHESKSENGRMEQLNKYMRKDPDVTFHTFPEKQIKDFIRKHENKENWCVVLHGWHGYKTFLPKYSNIIDFLNRYDSDKLKIKVLFFTHDFWCATQRKRHHVFLKKVLRAKNHYVFTVADNISILKKLHHNSLEKYKDKILCQNFWMGYSRAFLPFNENPILAVGVGGRTESFYKERKQMIQLSAKRNNNITRIPKCRWNIFMKSLNNFICGFSSSIHINGINTHCILGKTFEILAVGSLLLSIKSEEPYLNKIGLYHKVNCYIADGMSTIKRDINFILDPKNRKEIDKIRKAGQKHAKTSLCCEKLYEKTKNTLLKCFE